MAVSSPLLEDVSISGAEGVLVNITGGRDLTLHEVNEAATVVVGAAGEEANVIFGAVIDPNMDGEMQLTVIATGFGHAEPRLRLVEKLHAGEVSADDLDGYRKLNVNRGESRTGTRWSQGGRSTSMEVPAFLRNQVD